MSKKSGKQNYLDFVPVHCKTLEWDQEKGVVTIHRENKGFYNKIAQVFFHKPRYTHIDLDQYGTFVWNRIDGRRSVYEIGNQVKAEYGAQAEPLFERLVRFFEILHGNGFIQLSAKEKNL